jgi:alanine racemase
MSTNPEGRAWLRASSHALVANFERLRASVGAEARLIPMVKADAYGLGMADVVRVLRPAGPWGWGVATLGEGLRLRDLGVADPVVVLAPLVPAELGEAVRAGLQVSVCSLGGLEALAAAARASGVAASMHLDVDTGMGRTGFDWSAASEWMPRVAELAGGGAIDWIGCFTHLHSAEDDDDSVREQLRRFDEVLATLPRPKGDLMIHVLNSAGAFAAPAHGRDAIRPGIFLYGGGIGPGRTEPEPVVSLHARVCHIREASPGTTLGYNVTYRASRKETWATLSIGYGDGLPRSLTNRGSALIQGQRVPMVGRISMDLTVVDITDLSGVGIGDVATLLGAEGREEITLDELAETAGSVSYEILTRFTSRLPRIWT